MIPSHNDKKAIAPLATDLSKVVLRREVKERMRGELAAFADMHAVTKPLPSPVRSSASWTLLFQARTITAFILIISVLGGAQATAAAEGALPGEILYPVKVAVREPVALAFAPTKEKKAVLAAEFAGRRIDEAVKLSEAGKLDDKTAAQLAERFDTHAALLAEHSESTEESSEGDRELVLIARAELEEKIRIETAPLTTPEITLELATESVGSAALASSHGETEPVSPRALFASRTLAISKRLALYREQSSVNTDEPSKPTLALARSTQVQSAYPAMSAPEPVADVMTMATSLVEPDVVGDLSFLAKKEPVEQDAATTSTSTASTTEETRIEVPSNTPSASKSNESSSGGGIPAIIKRVLPSIGL